ncbi:hypothetical protein AAHC03_019102 [Spirometra sp. Aus1]
MEPVFEKYRYDAPWLVADELPAHLRLGSQFRFRVTILEVYGICNAFDDIFCQFFFENKLTEVYSTEPLPNKQANSRIEFCQVQCFTVPVTFAFIDYIMRRTLAFEVFGHAQCHKNLNVGHSTSITASSYSLRRCLPPTLLLSPPVPSRHADYTNRKADGILLHQSDLLVWFEILELSDAGEYVPVPVLRSEETSGQGAFLLHQGLQRRIAVTIVQHPEVSGGEDGLLAPPAIFTDVREVVVGRARDTPEFLLSDAQTQILSLSLLSARYLPQAGDDRTFFRFEAAWDSSLHGSYLLNRATPKGQRVYITMSCYVELEGAIRPACLTKDLPMIIFPRSSKFTVPRSLRTLIGSFLRQNDQHHVTGIYDLQLRRVENQPQDCYRSRQVVDTGSTYVRGEENIRGWRPRSDSLIIDHQVELEHLRRIVSVEKTKQFLQLRNILRRTNRFDALRQLDETISKIQQRSFSWLQLKAFSCERGSDSGFHSCPKDASSDTFWGLTDRQTSTEPLKKLNTVDKLDEKAADGFVCNCNLANESTSNPVRPTSLFPPSADESNKDAESTLIFRQRLLLVKCLKLLGYGKFSANLMSVFGISDFLTTPMDERALFSPAAESLQNLGSESVTEDHKDNYPALNDEACAGSSLDDGRQCADEECFSQCGEHQSGLLIAHCAEVRISPVVNRKGFLLLYDDQHPTWVRRWVVVRRPFLYIHENEKDLVERDIINLTTAKIEYSLSPTVEQFAGGFCVTAKNDSETSNDDNAAIFLLTCSQRKVYVKTPERGADVHEWLYAFNPLMAGEIR